MEDADGIFKTQLACGVAAWAARYHRRAWTARHHELLATLTEHLGEIIEVGHILAHLISGH